MKKLDGYLKQFVIQFSGLKLGQHDYEFELGEMFFQHYELEDVTNGKVHVDFTLTKRETSLLLEFDYHGILESVCDRCLEPLNIPVFGEVEQHVKFGAETNFENDELIILGHEEYQLDIAPLLYEYIAVDLPLRKVHEEDECNQDVIDRLESSSSDEEENNEAGPSVWDQLKKLK